MLYTVVRNKLALALVRKRTLTGRDERSANLFDPAFASNYDECTQHGCNAIFMNRSMRRNNVDAAKCCDDTF